LKFVKLLTNISSDMFAARIVTYS